MAKPVVDALAPQTSDAASGDLNAGFAFFLDCVVNLFVLSGILVGAFGFPTEIVFGKIIPGAIVGILVGNLGFVYYARRVASTTDQPRVTAIPLGLDLPTVFGMCFFVLGPLYSETRGALGDEQAAIEAWKVGMAAAFWMAGVKLLFSFVGRRMMETLPAFALIATMAGIATVWLGAEALLGVFELPEVGMVALLVMAVSLIAGHRLPANLPAAIVAILLGTLVYYVLAFSGTGDGYVVPETPALRAALPVPTLAGFGEIFGGALPYIGLILPFALLISTSSVNVVAGAKVVGDRFDAAHVVRLDAATTAISALFGGVVQTTPYFGHPTYKRMGAGTLYSLGAAAVIALGGFAGIVAFASVMIPSAVLKPILIVVASDIVRLSFQSGSVRHAPALLFALVPAILNYAATKMGDVVNALGNKATETLSPELLGQFILISTLSRGYILTSLLWGVLIFWIIDGRLRAAALTAFFAAALTAFGVIHSVLPSSGMYLPWDLPTGEMVATSMVGRLTVAYILAGLMLLVFDRVVDRQET